MEIVAISKCVNIGFDDVDKRHWATVLLYAEMDFLPGQQEIEIPQCRREAKLIVSACLDLHCSSNIVEKTWLASLLKCILYLVRSSSRLHDMEGCLMAS